MKRISLAIMLALFTLSLAAQDAIRVDYKGAKPTITDFAWAFLFSEEEDEEECDHEAYAGQKQALMNYRQGLPQEEGVTFTVDKRNGYILYEWKDNESDYYVKTEMCYWNESDGKHKLFAYNTWLYQNGQPAGGQYDGLIFYRYTNATKKMTVCDAPGFEAGYFKSSYTLPRNGKDIILNQWDENGKKTQKTLKWNGRRFNK